MKQLKQEIDTIIELINMLAEVIATGVTVSKEELIQTVGTSILQVFPEIVDSYESEELQAYREEIDYWSSQLDRLMNALQGDDLFCLYDVLVMETRESLKEYRFRIDK